MQGCTIHLHSQLDCQLKSDPICTTNTTHAAPAPRSTHSWSPAAIKSAIMTTAGQTTNLGNPIQGTPFDFGAGLINAGRAMDPGLVYDAGEEEWRKYICATTSQKASAKASFNVTVDCLSLSCSITPCIRLAQSINLPGFSLPTVKPETRVTANRAVTYVGSDATATFTASFQLPAGFSATIMVNGAVVTSLTFAAGETKPFSAVFASTKLAPKGWAFGSLTWTDSNSKWIVRVPIALQKV